MIDTAILAVVAVVAIISIWKKDKSAINVTITRERKTDVTKPPATTYPAPGVDHLTPERESEFAKKKQCGDEVF